jgi:flagellar biosynthesis/type III secretory pathway protein FliH
MSRARGILFAEDFDLAGCGPAPEPEIIAPVFTAADLEQARITGWQEGYDAARAELAAEAERGAQETAGAIAAQIAAARHELRHMAEESAETIARLLLESFAVAFPSVCAEFGEKEVAALLRTVLPALSQEPAVTVRACPSVLQAVAPEIERLDPDFAERVRLVPSAMPPGDVRISWHAGKAARDTASLWSEIAEILAPAGFLTAAAARRELADVK